MKKYIISSVLWGLLIILVQIVLNLSEKEPIDWRTAIIGGVLFAVVHLFVCCCRERVADKDKKIY